MKKEIRIERLSLQGLENVVGGRMADASRGGTDLGGPSSGGAAGYDCCVCVCACAPRKLEATR